MMDMNGAPNKSTTVDILFEDGDQSQDRYVIYMTESETEEYMEYCRGTTFSFWISGR